MGKGTGAVSSSLPGGDGVGAGPDGCGFAGSVGAAVIVRLVGVVMIVVVVGVVDVCVGARLGRRLRLHGAGSAKHDIITDNSTMKTTKV